MPITRSKAAANLTPQEAVEKLVSEEDQDKGQVRKHYVYFAQNKTLILVSIFNKRRWGLILIDEKGKVHQGQYVKQKIHPHKCGFDGEFFYWDAYIDNFFVIGKSRPPYFTAVEPLQWNNGWGFDAVTGKAGHKGWQEHAGGVHEIMWDLSSLEWERIKAPYHTAT